MSPVLPLDQAQLLRLSVDWLWRCDPNGTVTAVEPGRQALPAGLEQLLLGRRLDQVGRMTGAHRDLLQTMAGLAQLASSFKVQLTLDDPNCSWRGALVGMPVLATDQTLIGFAGSARARQAVQRSHEQQLANREMDNLYRTLSHDLQNPLNGVLGFSDLISRRHATALGPDGQRMLGLVRRSATDLKAIVDAVMELHRVAQMQPSSVEVNLSTLIAHVAAELRQQHPWRPASVNHHPPMRVWADLPLLQLMVAALLRRSWLAGPEAAPVVVDVTHQQVYQGVIISFADQGSEVDAQTAHELFVPLRDPRSKGSGHAPELGLALASRAAEHMGGWVWVDRPALGGQRVHVFLPGRHTPQLSDQSAP